MSFSTEYYDEYRVKEFKRGILCRPELRWADLEGKWMTPALATETHSDAEVKEFIRQTMFRLRGRSTYFEDYCANIPPEMGEFHLLDEHIMQKKKKVCPKEKPKKDSGEEDKPIERIKQMALKDTELIHQAAQLYARDLSEPTLKPLLTCARIMGYVRPSFYHTGLSEYQGTYSKLAFELVRDDRISVPELSNGGRDRWGIPPDGIRQPETDGLPFDGERIYA